MEKHTISDKFFLFNTRSQAKNFAKRLKKRNPTMDFLVAKDRLLVLYTFPDWGGNVLMAEVIGRIKKKRRLS